MEETIETPIIEQAPPPPTPEARTRDIGTRLAQILETKNIIIQTPEFQRVGVEAMEGTNEKGSPSLFEKVRSQEQAPNGYLIGVGFANVFSILEAFPEGITPRAMLLFDVDPEVVAYGQRFIEEMKSAPDYPEQKLGRSERISSELWDSDYKVALTKYGPMLQKLAREGNLVIARADLTDPRLVEEIANLPNYRELNNVIYLSNIADHLWRRQEEQNPDYIPDFSVFDTLEPNPPFRNYFIDTLTSGQLNYNLRVGIQPPRFDASCFWVAPTSLWGWQTRPIDEIEGTPENPVWEDISNWDLDHLKRAYETLANTPRAKAKRELIERRINEERSPENYDELKTHPPSEATYSKIVYEFPTEPEREAFLKKLLAVPYDYERDFIPFIASTIWKDAKFPNQVRFWEIPETTHAKDETGKYVIKVNPYDWVRGRIEIGYLKDLIFEELAMAKIYQELRRRGLEDKITSLS